MSPPAASGPRRRNFCTHPRSCLQGVCRPPGGPWRGGGRSGAGGVPIGPWGMGAAFVVCPQIGQALAIDMAVHA